MVSWQECEQIEWRNAIVANGTHVWIPEVEEGDGGNYTCELQYGSRLVRRTLLLKVTGKKLPLMCNAVFTKLKTFFLFLKQSLVNIQNIHFFKLFMGTFRKGWLITLAIKLSIHFNIIQIIYQSTRLI